jgi:hypothetical protein
MSLAVQKRQAVVVDDRRDYWWWSPVSNYNRDGHIYGNATANNCYRMLTAKQTAVAIKWAILTGLLLFSMAFFIGGYLHAKSRLKKGLPPMRYHRVRGHFNITFSQRWNRADAKC